MKWRWRRVHFLIISLSHTRCSYLSSLSPIEYANPESGDYAQLASLIHLRNEVRWGRSFGFCCLLEALREMTQCLPRSYGKWKSVENGRLYWNTLLWYDASATMPVYAVKIESVFMIGTYCVLEKKVKYERRKFHQFLNIERSKSRINNRKAVNSILIWHFNEINPDNRL